MSNDQKGSSFAAKAAQLGQLARGVAETIRAAMAGGLKGAAIAAAKNFLPQIIKVVVTIVAVSMLLPAILFFALPNIFFQLPSVGATDVRWMTEQSMRIDSLYQRMGALTQEEADKIIAMLSAGFDEAVVYSDFNNISRYWLIAISTVLHEQSLNISEDDVRAMLRQNIEYSYTTESWEEIVGEDEEGNPIYEIRTRINISIGNTDHERLMDRLGFTRFQRDWAYFLYENITVPQIVFDGVPGGFIGSFPGGGTHIAIRRALTESESRRDLFGGQAIMPLPTRTWRVTDEFGPRNFAPDPIHTGIDFAAARGTPIHSVMDGIVLLRLTNMRTFGHHIVIYHGGAVTTMYAHLSSFGSFDVGDEVSRGDVIGYVGNTGLSRGYHLHFEYQRNASAHNPRLLLPFS